MRVLKESRKTFFLLSCCLFLFVKITNAQTGYHLTFVKDTIQGAPALHSGVCVSYNGKWIFIGGRTNGLHGFQPPFAFPTSGRNELIYVVDPQLNQTWQSTATVFPDSIFEAICSSNMEYFLDDSILYIVGGYGWKNSSADFVTFPTLTSVNVELLINKIQNNQSITGLFHQTSDSLLAVTGGHLVKMNAWFYLVFGHRFDGTYAATATGIYIQTYTEQIRKFSFNHFSTYDQVTFIHAATDTTLYHRRDYNLTPQIFPDGSFGYTAFSGVFQKGINQPFFTTMNVQNDTGIINTAFNQQLANYHCAVLPAFDSVNNKMHSWFFGGMAMYHIDTTNGQMVSDTAVPFVKTISRVTRDGAGVMSEALENFSMHDYEGSNACIIWKKDSIELASNEVLRLDKLTHQTQVAWMVGGIVSPEPNISTTDPSSSFASPFIYKIFISPDSIAGLNKIIEAPCLMRIAPNPSNQVFNFELYKYNTNAAVSLCIVDVKGAVIKVISENKKLNKNSVLSWDATLFPNGIYYAMLRNGNYRQSFVLIKD